MRYIDAALIAVLWKQHNKSPRLEFTYVHKHKTKEVPTNCYVLDFKVSKVWGFWASWQTVTVSIMLTCKPIKFVYIQAIYTCQFSYVYDLVWNEKISRVWKFLRYSCDFLLGIPWQHILRVIRWGGYGYEHTYVSSLCCLAIHVMKNVELINGEDDFMRIKMVYILHLQLRIFSTREAHIHPSSNTVSIIRSSWTCDPEWITGPFFQYTLCLSCHIL